MKNLIIGVVIGILAAAGAWGVSLLFSKDAKSPADPEAALAAPTRVASNDKVVDLICELHLDLDGQMALGIQGNEPSRITLAQIDMTKSAGWYQGRISISESRAGNLTMQGNKFVVTRPAMFQRFGTTISQEQFTVDRTTGEFVQSLTVQDGRVIKLIKGTCAKVTKPPF